MTRVKNINTVLNSLYAESIVAVMLTAASVSLVTNFFSEGRAVTYLADPNTLLVCALAITASGL